MPTLIDRLRYGAENIHSIGPVRAADLIQEAAEAIEELQRAQLVASEPAVAALPSTIREEVEAELLDIQPIKLEVLPIAEQVAEHRRRHTHLIRLLGDPALELEE